MNNKDIVMQWLEYAKGDLRSAKALLGTPDIPMRNACYLAQQTAEKALKALWILLGINIIRTHDLDLLANKLPEDIRFEFEKFDLTWLTEWSVEARYPGEWQETTHEEAKQAVLIASGVLSTVVRIKDETL